MWHRVYFVFFTVFGVNCGAVIFYLKNTIKDGLMRPKSRRGRRSNEVKVFLRDLTFSWRRWLKIKSSEVLHRVKVNTM
jgi:hypothetical protein